MKLECPQCKSPVAREGQRFCYRCGHELQDYYKALNAQPDSSAQPPTVAPPDAADKPAEVGDPAPGTPERRSETMVMGAVDIPTDAAPPASATEQAANLRILLPNGDVFDRELSRAETQMGKGPRNDIVVSDPAVSATHALIRFEGGVYTVADIGSRNGTFVNGERINGPHQLKHGDVIGIGLSKITFRLAGHDDTSGIDPATLAVPPRPVAPPPLTEDSLAQMVGGQLVAPKEVERLRGPEARGRRLYRALVEERLTSEEALRDLMNRAFQIPIIDLRAAQIDEAMAAKFPSRLARERQVFPVSVEAGQLLLAVADPTDTAAVEEARSEVRLPVQTRLATATEITEQIDRHYGPKLIGVTPAGEKIEYPVNKVEIEIGKAAHNHIVLADPTVSSTHAIILARDGGYSIVDMGSRNGTFVNGERLGTQSHTLKHGDTIQVGQTLLTFKNSTQTTANMTAVLSAEALAEVRKRAESLGIIAPPAGAQPASLGPTALGKQEPSPVTMEPMAAPVAPPAAEAAAAKAAGPEEEKSEKKKKKKNKDKEGERLKAAYIGAVSRVVAQVLAVLGSVMLALYIVRQSMPTAPSSGTAPPGSTQMPPNSKFASPAGSPVAISGGKFEPSGVVHVPDSDGVLFVSDGKKDTIFWMQLDSSGRQVGSPQPVPLGVKINDPEAITYDNSSRLYYVVGSQSDPQSADQNLLVRFAFDPAGRAVQGTPEVVSDLRPFLVEKVPELRGQGENPGDRGGLNIEGMAWDPIGSRLLLGLRSPVLNGQALLVAMKLRNPRDPLSKENLDVQASAIPLSLEGQGVRDIQYNEELKSFVIISGAPETATEAEKRVFRIWEWDGDTTTKQADLDGSIKPEGITHVNLGGREFAFIVGDANSSFKLDYATGR